MSRALEKDVIAFLKAGDHTAVYNDVSQALTPRESSTNDISKQPRLLEIEILGRSHPTPSGQNLLRDENAIGVPKLRLVQAFIVARQNFRANIETGSSGYDELLRVTAVMLLMDAENLTAANTRKRILLQNIECIHNRGSSPPEDQRIRILLQQEAWFVDSLLTSRLHRHTKSPTLWSHRRWLIEQHRRLGSTVSVTDAFTVIKIAGERHPRNYYAWCHARWLLRTFRDDLTMDDMQSLQTTIQAWCMAHHNDVSGWSMLAHVQDLIGDEHASVLVFRNLLSTAEKYRWTNESVWWYLRTTAARLDITSEDRELFKAAQHRLLDEPDDGVHKVLDGAWQWYDRNRGTASFGIIGG